MTGSSDGCDTHAGRVVRDPGRDGHAIEPHSFVTVLGPVEAESTCNACPRERDRPGPKACQSARRDPRPKHVSRRRGLCHTHDRASSQVKPTNYDARIGGSTFLEVDPVEGGSANDYDYVAGDPVNQFDLDGNCLVCDWKNAATDLVTNPVETFKTGYRTMSPTGQALVETTLRVAPEGLAMISGGGAARTGWRVRPMIHKAHHPFKWLRGRKYPHIQVEVFRKGVRKSGRTLPRIPFPRRWYR